MQKIRKPETNEYLIFVIVIRILFSRIKEYKRPPTIQNNEHTIMITFLSIPFEIRYFEDIAYNALKQDAEMPINKYIV